MLFSAGLRYFGASAGANTMAGAAIRFAGFELDERRTELRAPGGEAVRLRPKPFAMLQMFLANAGRVLSKQELMEAVWPNVHVGEDSLFQCIREIRTALNDEDRRLVASISAWRRTNWAASPRRWRPSKKPTVSTRRRCRAGPGCWGPG